MEEEKDKSYDEEEEKEDDEVVKFAKVDFPAQDCNREEVTETAAVESDEQEAIEDVVFEHEEDPNAVESASCLQIPSQPLLKAQEKELRSEFNSDEEEAEAAKREYDKEPKGPKRSRRSKNPEDKTSKKPKRG